MLKGFKDHRVLQFSRKIDGDNTQMHRKVLLRLILALGFTMLSWPAFSQAISESVMLGASSSTAAAKAGSVLNSLNRSGKQFAERVQPQVSRPQQRKRPRDGENLLASAQNNGTAGGRAPQQGELTIAIQGAKPNCAVTDEQSSAGQDNGSLQTPPTKCLNPNTSGKSGSKKYKSVVTFTFAK